MNIEDIKLAKELYKFKISLEPIRIRVNKKEPTIQ